MSRVNCSWGLTKDCPAGYTGRLIVSEAYKDPNTGVSKFSTKTKTNPDGYVNLVQRNVGLNPILEKIDFVVQDSGAVVYFSRGESGTRTPIGTDIQQVVDHFGGGPKLAEEIRNSMKYNLNSIRNRRSITPAGTSPTAPTEDSQGGSNTEDSSNTQSEVQAIDTIPFGNVGIASDFVKYDQNGKKFAPSTGLRYPIDITGDQDRIEFLAVALSGITGVKASSYNPSTTPTTPTNTPTPPPNTPTTPPPPNTPTTPTPPSGETQLLDFSFGQKNYTPVDNPVIISIQAPISDQNLVEWGSTSANAVEAAMYDAALKSQTDTQGAIQQISNSLLSVVGEHGDKIRRELAGRAAGINNILARTDNVILNPNLELLFSNPQLRSFNFTFKMSARSKPEATEIKKIINYFKYHMAVRNDDQIGLFLRSPRAFEITYKKNGTEPHPGLNRIKRCALMNFSVDYTPLGSYATYEDNSMVAYTLSLQFQELTPVYSGEYADHATDGKLHGQIAY